MHGGLTRRVFSAGAVTSLAMGSVGCASGSDAYDAALQDMTRPLPRDPDFAEFVRFATLAANGHNTQPWRFARKETGAEIRADFARRTPVVDPDDHHLYVSLGCAAENMALAARARGLSGEIRFAPEGEGVVEVDLAAGAREESPLLAAITARQVTRATYDGAAPPSDVMARLVAAARTGGTDPIFITDRTIEDVLALVIEGNTRQMDDDAFMAELKHWLRFNARSAAATRDGLYSASSGNPTLPSWLGPTMFDLFFSKEGENDKYAEQVRSSAGLVVFVGRSDDKAGWIEAGRAYQRFALQATADGLKHAFVNQAVEVPEMRSMLQALLGLGDRRPDLVVRFGYGPAMPKSLRRKPQDVIAA